MKVEFFRQSFGKKNQLSDLKKIRSAGAELLHPDGQTDMTQRIVASRNFADPKTSPEA